MSNAYNAKALAWQLIIDDQSQPILCSNDLREGTSFSISGTLPGSYYVYVIEMMVTKFVNLLFDSESPLSDDVVVPGDGGSLVTDARCYVRAVAAPEPVPADAWPDLVPKLFHINREGPPSAGNSNTM